MCYYLNGSTGHAGTPEQTTANAAERSNTLSTRGNYRSKHYDTILNYLESAPGRHFTIDELHDALNGLGHPIGSTTIYRHLNRMLDEGLISKYSVDPGTPACYEYIRVATPEEITNCYHCKCEVCGRLIHLRCEEISEFAEHLRTEHGFTLNPMRTVLYGICKDCGSNPKPLKIKHQ